jgi:hypothetical protein
LVVGAEGGEPSLPPCKSVSDQAGYLPKQGKALLKPLRSAKVGTDWHPLAYVAHPFCLLGWDVSSPPGGYRLAFETGGSEYPAAMLR